MMTLPKDFKELLSIFNANDVHYLVVGGYAVAYFGYVRATNDLDIWIDNCASNVEKVIRCLVEFGFPERDLHAEAFTQKDNIIRMGVPPFRIEILTSVSGLTFAAVYPHRVIAKISDIEILFIDVKHLKINKKASGRHKDLDDLENL
ncbi:MAG: hypothetical protein JXD23_06720 [Spirochaetales bacterium]|nr:hypothetical protein [Spirochaetales bacterium]